MRATMTAAAQAAQASEAPAPAGGGGGGSQAGGGGTPQAAILQSRALVTPPVTVVGQVSFQVQDNVDLSRKELLTEQNKEFIFIHLWK